MNLNGLMQLATRGQYAGVDLWSFQTKDGRGIRKALDFLVPVALGEKKWAYAEIEGGVKPQILFPLMRRAAQIYKDKPYQALISKVPELSADDRRRLLEPEPAAAKQAQR
jgi:hypothetical protein